MSELENDSSVEIFRRERKLRMFDLVSMLARNEQFKVNMWQKRFNCDGDAISYDLISELEDKNEVKFSYYIGIIAGCYYDEEVEINRETVDFDFFREFVRVMYGVS